MKRFLLITVIAAVCTLSGLNAKAQCSICTKTAQQMGDKPASGLNAGILYLAVTPLALIGFIGFRWWRNNGRKA
jgi:hypothetical protein